MPFKDPAVVKGTTAGSLQFMLYCKQQRSDWHGRRNVMELILSLLCNQYFLVFITVATGLLLGRVRIKSFCLEVSGGIFTGIFFGWLVIHLAKGIGQGEEGYELAQKILENGVVSSDFFNFFLLVFLTAIGLTVGKNIGSIFKKYGIKIAVIGFSVPITAMAVTMLCCLFMGKASVNGFEMGGMYTGAMTSTPAYGASLDVISAFDMESKYEKLDETEQEEVLDFIGAEETTEHLTQEQAITLKEAAATAVSLGYTVAFPVGVFVIVILITIMPKMFRIDIEEEKRQYFQDMKLQEEDTQKAKDPSVDFLVFGLVAALGILLGKIAIPLGNMGTFSLGAGGGVLIAALICSYFGKIGPVNFRMDTKELGLIRELGLTFFMAVTGLMYGYDVVTSLSGSGLPMALMAVVVAVVAIFVSFFIGRKVFKLNWVILSGAICGGCTSAPGLGATITAIGDDEPTAGYGAAQPFAILANVILMTLFHSIVFF